MQSPIPTDMGLVGVTDVAMRKVRTEITPKIVDGVPGGFGSGFWEDGAVICEFGRVLGIEIPFGEGD